jgi:hypothetical protein
MQPIPPSGAVSFQERSERGFLWILLQRGHTLGHTPLDRVLTLFVSVGTLGTPRTRREAFFRLPAPTDTQKVPLVSMEPLTDAVCQAAKWLKSSVEKLSDKSLWHPQAPTLVSRKALKRCFLPRSEFLRYSTVGSFWNYQTVSRMIILRTSA